MQVLDYGRSFVTFVSEGGRYRNNARLQIESRTTLTDTRSGESTRYMFFASCKSEDTLPDIASNRSGSSCNSAASFRVVASEGGAISPRSILLR